MFLLIDSDGNGQISVQELASRTERSMKTFYRQEANTRLMELDKNVDGKVTWEEYIKGANNRGGQLRASPVRVTPWTFLMRCASFSFNI